MKILSSRDGKAGYVALACTPSASRRIVCFHYAGGSAQAFFPWRASLPSDVDLMAIELPGRGRHQNLPFAESIASVADELAAAYASLSLKTTVFYGHSLGALVAYETARRLRQRGVRELRQLIVSSRAAPGSQQFTASLPPLADHHLHAYLKNLNGTPKSILDNPEMMRLVLPVLRADLKLVYEYEPSPGPVLDIPIEVIGATADEWAPIECLLEWRRLTTAKFKLHMIEGGHFAPVASPSLIAEILGQQVTNPEVYVDELERATA